MSPAFTLSSKSDAANALKVGIGADEVVSPVRTFLSSFCKSVNASSAAVTSTLNRTSFILPVRESTARPRTRNPPSFLRQTPGLDGLGAIHEFHFCTHFCSVICTSTRRRTGASDREVSGRAPAHKRVEVFAAPHPGARASTTTCRGDAPFARGFAKGARRL